MATKATGSETFDLGRVVQRGIDAFRKQALVFVGLALILVGIPALLMQIFFARQLASGDFSAMFSPVPVVAFLVLTLAGYLLQAAVVRVTIRSLSGDPVELGSNLLFALKILLPVVGLSLLVALVAMLGLILLIVPGVMFLIASSVAIPVLVEERPGVIASIKRSFELTRGSRWWILLLLVLLLFASSILSGARMAAFPSTFGLVPAALESLFSAISSLIFSIFLASLYLELRLIKEGVGAQGLAAIFE